MRPAAPRSAAATAELATLIPGQAMQVSFAGSANGTARIAVTADAALSSQCYSVSLLAPTAACSRPSKVATRR